MEALEKAIGENQTCALFPFSLEETLAMLYVSQQNVRQWTVANFIDAYCTALKVIWKRLDEEAQNGD